LASSNIDRILDSAKDHEMVGSQKLVETNVGKAVDEAVSLSADLKGMEIVNECEGLNVLAAPC
jgi:hypothetical protein